MESGGRLKLSRRRAETVEPFFLSRGEGRRFNSDIIKEWGVTKEPSKPKWELCTYKQCPSKRKGIRIVLAKNIRLVPDVGKKSRRSRGKEEAISQPCWKCVSRKNDRRAGK